jgi:hypothetical protein
MLKKAIEFDFRTIKSFEDACQHLGIDPLQLPDVSNILAEFAKPIVAAYKLMIIYKAINNGWTPDWSNYDQRKYFAWLEVLPSGSGFSISLYYCTRTPSNVGSRLCSDTSAKVLYIAEQFKAEYQDYFLLP